MSSEVRVPALGESVVEATIGAWLKSDGDFVAAGEALVQLETEKVNLDVSADLPGVLQGIQRQVGDTVHPGDVLAVIDAAPANAATPSAETPGSTTPAASVAAPDAAGLVPVSAQGTDEETRPHASPLARRIAEENGVDLGRLTGSGTGGRVTRDDVTRFIGQPGEPKSTVTTEKPVPASVSGASPGLETGRPTDERIRMTRRRQTIAARLLEAQRTAAMLTTFNEVDMSAVIELRARRKDAFRERHGVGLGFMSFFTKAVVGALKAFPDVNAEVQGDEIVRHRYYDIGIAVGAEGGLVVPVVRDADQKTFAQIEQEISSLAEKARANTLTLEHLRGGTFTITNGGVFGSLLSTPILSPPQVGILGMHKIQDRPVAIQGEVVIKPMMYLALSYDHRLVDGRGAVQFLVRVKELIEDPEALLLEG